MIREQVLQVWNNLKAKMNQLSSWPKTFPNQQPYQVQSRINTLQTNYNSANETISQRNVQVSNLTGQLNTWTNMFPSKNAEQIKEELTSTKNDLNEKIDEFFNLYVKYSQCSSYCKEKHSKPGNCNSDDDEDRFY